MQFRDLLVADDKAISNNGTTTVDMAGNEIVNAVKMFIRVSGTSNFQADVLTTIIEHLTKATLVGDSDVELMSLTGDELAALWFYDQKQIPDMQRITYGHKSQWAQLNFNFGEFFMDPRFGCDFGKWENIKLSLTFDDFSTMFKSTTMTARVSKVLMEDMAGKPKNWLRKIELADSKPAAANQEINYTIAKDMKLRALLFLIDPDLSSSTNIPTNYPTTDSNEFTFTMKDGKVKIYDKAQIKSIFRENAARYGHVLSHGRFGLNTSNAIDSLIGYVESAVSAAGQEVSGADTTLAAFRDDNNRYQQPKFAGTSEWQAVHFRGTGFMSSIIIPFDLQGIAGYLDTKAKGLVQSKWKPTSADHALRLVKDELMVN
jgi:hypothetical protein